MGKELQPGDRALPSQPPKTQSQRSGPETPGHPRSSPIPTYRRGRNRPGRARDSGDGTPPGPTVCHPKARSMGFMKICLVRSSRQCAKSASSTSNIIARRSRVVTSQVGDTKPRARGNGNHKSNSRAISDSPVSRSSTILRQSSTRQHSANCRSVYTTRIG